MHNMLYYLNKLVHGKVMDRIEEIDTVVGKRIRVYFTDNTYITFAGEIVLGVKHV